jgi:hypothetical protein
VAAKMLPTWHPIVALVSEIEWPLTFTIFASAEIGGVYVPVAGFFRDIAVELAGQRVVARGRAGPPGGVPW